MSKVILGALFAALMFVSPISSAEDMKATDAVQQADAKVATAKADDKAAKKAEVKADENLEKAQDAAEQAVKDAAKK